MATPIRSIVFAVGLVASLAAAPTSAVSATLQWFGHASFLVTSPQGVAVVMDPFGSIGYAMPEVAADVVTVSHEHGDHNVADWIGGSPVVLRGLKDGGAGWNDISFRSKDVQITALPAYHDDVEGRRRGLNTIFVVEAGGVRIAHLSDIGHVLSDDTIEALGRVDVLLIPVGGKFSIDGRQARRIMARLKPRVTVPIHYKTAVTADWPIADAGDFLAGLDNVRRLGESVVTITPEALPAAPEVWMMRYE